MCHRGRSTRRARECFVGNEIGLEPIIGAAVALTHPERFFRFEELDMDLPGAEFDDPASVVRFAAAPCLNFHVGRVEFGTKQYDDAYDFYGSASWFLPQ